MLKNCKQENIPSYIKGGKTVSKPLLYDMIEEFTADDVRQARERNIRDDLDYWHSVARKVARERNWNTGEKNG